MKKRIRISREMRTAYHEAGHAVVAFDLKQKTTGCSIERVGDSLGRVELGEFGSGDPENSPTPTTVAKLERRILCIMAGGAAEARIAGRRNFVGASADRQKAIDLAEYLAQGPVLDKYVVYMQERARAHVGSKQTWFVIEYFAMRLLEERKMSGRKTIQTIRDGYREWIRSRRGAPFRIRKIS